MKPYNGITTSVLVYAPLLLLAVGTLRLSEAQSVEPAPIVVPPSEYWEGDDGPWSSFQMRVGSPAQDVRLMVSTASPVTWVVLEQACPDGDTSACATDRGGIFNLNQSSTWKDQGFFDLFLEGNLNYTGNGEYGLDTVGLGLTSTQGPTLESQVVAGIVTPEFEFGVFGLNPQPTNFSNFDNPIPSYFESLKTQNLIPSLTWSYTAGNQYSLKKVLGNLIFGGYDASRFTPSDLTFTFAPDSSRDIVVGVQSISSTESNGKTTELLTSGILAFIDSTIPYIYLPLEVCQAFENAFGLEWDPVTELYLISSSEHSALVARNLNFTFTLGNTVDSGTTTNIVLPYAAFDLTVNSPVANVNESSSYFPLKRGNDSQYTLGRTFLQEAYLTVDYERGNFTVSQCVFNEGAQEDVVIIHPLGYVAPNNGTANPDGTSVTSNTKSSSFPIGAIVGVVFAVVILVVLAILLFFAYRKRKWPFQHRKPAGAAELDSDAVGYEADGTMIPGKYALGDMPHEAVGDNKFNYSNTELDSKQLGPGNELPGVPVPIKNILGSHGELHGSDAALEMEGSGFFQELPGSPVPVEYYGNSRAMQNLSREGSQTTTRAGSLRDEAMKRGSAGGVRSPLSPSGLSVPSPVTPQSASRDISRNRTPTGRTMSDSSERGVETSYRMSPVSAGSESRERNRTFEGTRNVSPMRLGGRSGDPLLEDVSRDPSRTRGEDRGDGYHGP